MCLNCILNFDSPLLLGGDKAILVVGGADGTAGTSADILHADGTSWCSKKIFSQATFVHTLSGTTVCGGRNSEGVCVPYQNNTWNQTASIDLRNARKEHSSWQSSAGIVLMGGGDSLRTSEIVNNGMSKDYFDLQYDTR